MMIRISQVKRVYLLGFLGVFIVYNVPSQISLYQVVMELLQLIIINHFGIIA